MHPGDNVGMGKDHTLFALADGHVQFLDKGAAKKHMVNVVPVAAELIRHGLQDRYKAPRS